MNFESMIDGRRQLVGTGGDKAVTVYYMPLWPFHIFKSLKQIII